jgi:hypothetical protein
MRGIPLPKLLVFTIVWLLCTPEARTQTLRGTVNIVLGNANGIVALTDSLQTGLGVHRKAQKLFVLDDRTICTIAGFASRELPNDISVVATDVINEYVDSSGNRSKSFDEKFALLRIIFEIELGGIGNVKKLTIEDAGRFEFELILAGYDLDGAARVRKLVLKPHLEDGFFQVRSQVESDKVIIDDLQAVSAGVGEDAVDAILGNPTAFPQEPELSNFAKAKLKNATNNLSLEDLSALAACLGRHAFIWHSSVIDTQFQIAVLRKDRPIMRTGFSEIRLTHLTEFYSTSGLIFDGGGVPGIELFGAVPQGSIAVFYHQGFRNGGLPIDNAVFYKSAFSNVTLRYNGGALRFEVNDVKDCELFLGTQAVKNPDAVKVLNGYAWKKITVEGGLPALKSLIAQP